MDIRGWSVCHLAIPDGHIGECTYCLLDGNTKLNISVIGRIYSGTSKWYHMHVNATLQFHDNRTHTHQTELSSTHDNSHLLLNPMILLT